MRGRLALLAAVVFAWAGGAVAGPSVAANSGPVAYLKTCSSGWTHGVIGGVHKCLRAGQFCARRYERDYHRYGFHCHRYDRSVGRYRLSR